MIFPGKINISGAEYDVTYVYDPEAMANWGKIDPDNRLIRIYAGKGDREAYMVLIHEILHGILLELDNDEWADDKFVSPIACMLGDTLIRNDLSGIDQDGCPEVEATTIVGNGGFDDMLIEELGEKAVGRGVKVKVYFLEDVLPNIDPPIEAPNNA